MLKIVRLITTPIRYPLRLAMLLTVAVAGAIALGDEIAPIRHAASSVFGWSTSLFSRAYDPGTTSDPVQELDFLRDLDDEVRPDLDRARALIRERRADIEYARELASFVGRRVPAEEMERLRAAISDDGRPEVPTAAISAAGQSWLAYQEKIRRLESELERLLTLETRVAGLYGKLDERRAQTQGLVPGEAEAPAVGADTRPSSPQMSEAEELLSDVHERLFKALYTLSPGLVNE